MGQVRKDILNGWKEIGGYVCRDIRTVERWEKQRGLPVRRMPGAGRATVYALISELDDWLENSGPDTAQPDLYQSESAKEPHGFELQGATESIPSLASSSKPQPSSQTEALLPHSSPIYGNAADPRNPEWIGTRTLTIALSLGFLLVIGAVLAWPVLRSHAKPLTAALPIPVGAATVSQLVPYRSRVTGVDDLYLRGVYSYEQRTPESLQRARDDFSAASMKDPSYAPAYDGLANVYNLMREYAGMPDAEAYPKAKDAAEHAIALDPRLPDAHASLGFIDFFWSWDAAAAEHQFQTALALDPTSVLAHHWYGSMLMHEGRLTEAMEQLDTAQRLEPNSAAILNTRALAMGLGGHRAEAVEMLQDVIHETPEASSPHAILATLSRIAPTEPARFLAEMRQAALLRNDAEDTQVFADAAAQYRLGGERKMWQAILATEERLHPGTNNRTYMMADAESAMGDKDAAIADLTSLASRHNPALVGMLIDPNLASLRSDRRFDNLVRSIGLPLPGHPLTNR